MKAKDLSIIVLLVMGMSFLLSFTFLRCEPSRSTATVTGKVEWVAFDEDNQISHVAISTSAEEYMVGNDDKGKELRQFVNKRVRVRGRVTESEDGQRTIYVSKYELVPQ